MRTRLKLGWPVTEWENGDRTKSDRRMAGGNGQQNPKVGVQKWPGQMVGRPKFRDFCPIVGPSRVGGRRPFHRPFFAGVLRGNTIRGNTTRNSERKMAL